MWGCCIKAKLLMFHPMAKGVAKFPCDINDDTK